MGNSISVIANAFISFRSFVIVVFRLVFNGKISGNQVLWRQGKYFAIKKIHEKNETKQKTQTESKKKS